MKLRILITTVLVLASAGMLWPIMVQRRNLTELRANQTRLLNPLDAPSVTAPAYAAAGTDDASVSPELLRLRGEVTRLLAQRRELEPLRAENERLRNQLSTRTNVPAGMRLPAGFMRKSEARNVGYNTVDDTMQTFLWALQGQNFEALMDTMTPRMQSKFQQTMGDNAARFFEGAKGLIGIAIVGRTKMDNGAIELQAVLGPDINPQSIYLEPVNGQWKISKVP